MENILLAFVYFLSIASCATASNFTFTYTQPTQCGNIAVSWSGGTPPFQLTITRIFGTPYTVPIPSSSYSNGQGSFETQVLLKANENMLITMSDANGFSTGGTSGSLPVSPPTGSSSNCNTTDPGVDFYFDADQQIIQCSPYHFSGYTSAVQPITIIGIVPAGETFILNPPVGPTDFTWIPDVVAGTSLVFTMTDAKGRMGGTTQTTVVGVNSDASCLTGNTPQTLDVHPSETTTGNASPTVSSPSSQTSASGGSSSSGVSGGAIAGAIIGTLLAVAVAASLLWFFWWRRRSGNNAYGGSALPYRSRRRDADVDLLPETTEGAASHAISPYPLYNANSGPRGPGVPPSSSNLLNQDNPFDGQSSYVMANPYSVTSMSRPGSEADSGVYGGLASLQGGAMAGGSDAGTSLFDSTMSPARRKAAMAGMTTYNTPARFILHTDAEDENISPPEEEVVELPPQYTERRLVGRPSTIAEETSSGYSVPLPSSSTSTPSRAGAPLPPLQPPPPSSPRDATPPSQSTSASVLDRVDAGAASRLQLPMTPSTPVTPSPTGHYGKSFLP